MKPESRSIEKIFANTGLTAYYHVPASKSVLARDIMLLARCGKDPGEIKSRYISTIISGNIPSDIETLLTALTSEGVHDCGESGTALRFLTVYFSSKKGPHIITGSKRLSERPIKGLLEVLERSGSRFRFIEKNYSLPFEVCNPQNADLSYPDTIDATQFPSSQYISALLLSGCDSRILLGERIPSRPYLDLTIARMRAFGLNVEQDEHSIKAEKGKPTPLSLRNNGIGDWSSAWYLIAHLILQPGLQEITIANLTLSSGQPDEALFHSLKERFGLEAIPSEKGLVIKKKTVKTIESPRPIQIDLLDNPDQFLTIGGIALGLGIPFKADGIEHLKEKESDRIVAYKTNARVMAGEDLIIKESPHSIEVFGQASKRGKIQLCGFNDHRVVMSFATIGASPLSKGRYVITDPQAVEKSFPGFWNELYGAR